MKYYLRFISSFICVILLGVTAANAKCAKIKPTRPGEIYLLRAAIYKRTLELSDAQIEEDVQQKIG